MSLEYRKPGVYVEESLRVGSADVGAANTATLFVGAAPTGPIDAPVRVGSWSEYVSVFGGFDKVVADGEEHLSYLPYAVYCYFQNGGRPAYCMRSVPSASGSAGIGYATTDTETALDVEAAVYDDETNLVTVTITGHGLVTGDEVYVEYQAAGDAAFEYLKAGGVKVPVTVTGPNAFTYPSATAGADGALTLSGTDKVFAYLERVFRIEAKFNGANSPVVEVYPLADDPDVFHLTVLVDDTVVEQFRFQGMAAGTDGVAYVVDQVNDPFNGSKYIQVSVTAAAVNHSGAPSEVTVSLSGGEDPDLPGSEDLRASTVAAIKAIDQPILVNVPGYLDTAGDYVSVSPSSSDVPSRKDVFYINDNAPRRTPGMSNSSYYSVLLGPSALANLAGDSYVAAYGPWITIPNPASRGTITVPPGGAVAGVFSRTDATIGVFRAPAGVIAGVSNAIAVDAQFSDSELGTLNARNINIIRPVNGQGIAIMGARTRKPYGVDRYVNARRTLIYIKESLRRSTEYALFENNDQRLWNQLYQTADRILRPLWEVGGLKGTSSADAYFIKCDSDINTPQVVESGEVRMEVGVSLETPAEFIVIRVTQYERGGVTADVI